MLDKIIFVEILAGLNFCALAKVYLIFIDEDLIFVDLIFADFSLCKNLILANISCYMVYSLRST